MLPPSLAAALNRVGCDTVAISADAGLRGSSDAEVLESAAVAGTRAVAGLRRRLRRR